MMTFNTVINLGFIILLSYIIGSIPTSIIVGKVLRGIDIRDYGSGNAGATNCFRVLGWKAGIFVVLVDILKGFVPAYFVSQITILSPSYNIDTLAPVVAGAVAVFGHCYTIFAGFRGGKGIATSAGMLIAISPLSLLVCSILFFAVLFATGYVSVSSMTAALTFPITLIIFKVTGISPVGMPFLIFSLIVCPFIFYSHRSNISRLRSGTERRFDKLRIFKKKQL